MNIEQFLQIEDKYNLYTDRIDGVAYWEISRFSIWNNIFCKEGMQLGVAHRSETKGRFGRYYSLLRYWIKGTRNVGHAEILISCHYRRVMEDGLYHCLYTEDIADKYDSITLEVPYNGRHLKPAQTKNLVYTDAIVMKAAIYSFFHCKLKTNHYKQILSEIKKRLDDPLEEMLKIYGLDIKKETIYQLIVKTVLTYKKYYLGYQKLIKQIDPKLIVEVVYYGLYNMAINQAARELGITIVELQHGTMHKEHGAYQYAVNEEISELPDYVLTFSDFWNNIAHMPSKSTQLISVGFPYLEKRIKKYLNKYKKDDSAIVILFISQPPIGAKLSELAVELCQRLDDERFRIIYKLHPDERADWKEEYKWLADEPDIDVVDTLEKNIYEYFAQSDVQVGVYSTAIYEGLAFGLDTYIYNVGFADTMESLIEFGYAKMFDNVDKLVSMLLSTGHKPNKSPVFWKENAWYNMQKEIDHLLENGKGS